MSYETLTLMISYKITIEKASYTVFLFFIYFIFQMLNNFSRGTYVYVDEIHIVSLTYLSIYYMYTIYIYMYMHHLHHTGYNVNI